MKNKLLLLIVVLLIPISVFIKKDEKIEEHYDSNITEEQNKILVHLNYNNKEIELDLNDYLIGVVGMEMPASFNEEALKAQAIASRTFALSSLNDNNIYTSITAQSYADINTLKNKWKEEFELYYEKIKKSVLSTDNLVMKYDDKIIKSYYFSMSNGKTEDVLEVFNEELPYLESVDSSFDESQKNFEVSTTFTKENFCSLLSITNCNNILITDVIRDNSNRVSSLKINDINYLGIDVRKLLSLRSTDFLIEIKDNIIITTKGYGHGVGMSQYGANYLANNGYKYDEILKYYYKNISIEKI